LGRGFGESDRCVGVIIPDQSASRLDLEGPRFKGGVPPSSLHSKVVFSLSPRVIEVWSHTRARRSQEKSLNRRISWTGTVKKSNLRSASDRFRRKFTGKFCARGVALSAFFLLLISSYRLCDHSSRPEKVRTVGGRRNELTKAETLDGEAFL
jgi:hypothetical protein